MEFAKVDAADKLHFLGDYIDRGEHSFEVLRDVRKYQEQGAVVLRGNHEDMHILWLMNKWDNENYKENGGGNTVRSFRANMNDDEYAEMVAWMSQLPYTHQDDEFFYVHAGIVPFSPSTEMDDVMELKDRTWFDSIDEMPDHEMVWVRNDFFGMSKDHVLALTGGRKVVHGHTPMVHVLDDGARINIDLGAGSKHSLALVNLTDRFVYSYDWIRDSFSIAAIHEVERKFG